MQTSPENPEQPRSADTSSSLLDGVKTGDSQAWSRLVKLYSPVVYSRCRRAGFDEHDAAEVTQEVFTRVHKSINSFRRDQANYRFRKWFATVVRTSVVDFIRARLKQIDAPGGSQAYRALQNHPDILDEESWTGDDGTFVLVMKQALNMIEADFEPQTWRAFWMTSVETRPAVEVAEELGMNANAVRQAKLRVTRRLKVEFDGLLD